MLNSPFRLVPQRRYQSFHYQTKYFRLFTTNTKPHDLRQTQEIVLSIHQELLRQAKLWPTEKGREDRCIKHPLIDRLENDIKSIEEITDVVKLIQMGKKANGEIQSVKDLIQNKYHNEFKLAVEYLVPDVVKQEKILLSTRAQDKMRKKKWGHKDRLLTWWFSSKIRQADDDTPKKE